MTEFNQKYLEHLTHDWAGVTVDVKWKVDLVFSVQQKMFAVYCFSGKYKDCISFKVADDAFLALTDQPHIVPAPYAARFKWITVQKPGFYGDTWLREKVRGSYLLVAQKLSKKTQKELGLIS